jgi:hypothetical protein
VSLPSQPGADWWRPLGGRWENIPARPAVILRSVDRRSCGALTGSVKATPSGSPAARANARRPGREPSRAETGARTGPTTAALSKSKQLARQVVVVFTDQVPVTEPEVLLTLHWAGDLLADLIKADGTGG